METRTEPGSWALDAGANRLSAALIEKVLGSAGQDAKHFAAVVGAADSCLRWPAGPISLTKLNSIWRAGASTPATWAAVLALRFAQAAGWMLTSSILSPWMSGRMVRGSPGCRRFSDPVSGTH